MGQILRPNADVVEDNLSGGNIVRYGLIDEVAADIDDYVNTNALSNGETAQYICGLTNPTDPVGVGPATFRLVAAANGAGAIMQVFVLQGDTIVASAAPVDLPTSFTSYLLVSALDGVTDYTDLRLAFNFQGVVAGTRSAFVAWAELELPDLRPSGMMLMF